MAKKTSRKGSKGRSAKGHKPGKKTGKKRAKRSKAKDYSSPIGPGMSKKGQVPLRVLEKRLVKLNAIVLKRGGRYLAA